MNEQRALLDQLMGLNRDGDRPEDEVEDFRDNRVCKKFLAGLCVHDLFSNTKMDLGECAKLHLSDLKQKYDLEKKADKNFRGYELDIEKELIKYNDDIKRRIAAAQRRIEENGTAAGLPINLDAALAQEDSTEMLEVTAEIQETMEQVEQNGMEGQVELSMELMERVEQLVAKKTQLKAQSMTTAFNSGLDVENQAQGNLNLADGIAANFPGRQNNVNQKLRVCDVCAAYLSIFDSDRRLADHFGGKLHLGYLQITKKLAEIKKIKEERGEVEQKNENPRRSRSRERERKQTSHRRDQRRSHGDDRRDYGRRRPRSRSHSRGRDTRRRR